jgi:hypothetical protein
MVIFRKIGYLLLQFLVTTGMLTVLSVASAEAQVTPIYPGQTTQLHEEPDPGDVYTWELYRDSTVNFAMVPGDCPPSDAYFTSGNTGPTVNVTWLKPGIYFFKVTAVDATACTNNVKIGKIKVEEALPTAELAVHPDSVCIGEWANLTVTFTGTEPWSFTLRAEDKDGVKDTVYTNIGTSGNPWTIPVGPKTTTVYTVIQVTDAKGTQNNPSSVVRLKVYPLPKSSRIYVKKQ